MVHSDHKNKCPVLFLIFNRPNLTKESFNNLRKFRPKKLYIAADGPRNHVDGEHEIVERVRNIVDAIDWDCDVKKFYQSINLGCKRAVSNAINWFFSHEEAGIILEDDCIPDHSFFCFCEELLQRYRYDSRIFAISGDNFQNGIQRSKYSYYYSRYPHCWGWATWKRAWNFWDGNMQLWPEIKEANLLYFILDGNKELVYYWTAIFEKCFNGEIDSWNYPWIFTCFVNRGLTILPDSNLVSNIGFDSSATHTKKINKKQAALERHSIEVPLSHPPWLIRHSAADEYTEREILGLYKQKSQFLSGFRTLFKN